MVSQKQTEIVQFIESIKEQFSSKNQVIEENYRLDQIIHEL
jgi:hypothetical protein